MQIKLISFSENKMVSLNAAHEIIIKQIKEKTGVKADFLYCSTQKEMFAGVKDGVESSDIIVLAVDVSRFISTKAALFRALGFKCKLDSEINELINSDACMATLNENQVRAHAAIPVGGEAFITFDGLFSGIGMRAGKQKLVFVPIDEKRIEAIIENGMIEFIADGFVKDEELSPVDDVVEEAEDINQEDETIDEAVEEVAEEEVAEEKEPQPETEYVDVYSTDIHAQEEKNNYEDVNSYSYNEDDVPQEKAEESILEKIESRGIMISFVRQTENTVYTNVLGEIASSKAVDFVDLPIDRSLTDDAKRKENIASNARTAMKQSDSAYAIAMSEILFDENGAGYIFATLSDLQKSSVYKIFAADDETDKDLYRTGLESLLEKIEEHSRSINSRPIVSASEETEKSSRKLTPSTLIVVWILVIIAVGTLTALILDMALSKDASLASSASAIISDINNLLLR